MKNSASLIGRVGKDPEVRTFDGGNKLATFSLATTKKWKDKASGETKEKTEWHNIVVNGALVNVVERYVKKGDLLSVDGEIRYRTYNDKDGNTRYIAEIAMREMQMLGGKRSDSNATAPVEPASDDESSDLPF